MSYDAYAGIRKIQDHDATMVELEIVPEHSDVVVVTGSSRRARGDSAVPAVGEALALARALRCAADKLENRARDLDGEVNGEDEEPEVQIFGSTSEFLDYLKAADI